MLSQNSGRGELLFCSCDLELNPMTFTYELNLTIVKMYLSKKMNILRQNESYGITELLCVANGAVSEIDRSLCNKCDM